MPRFVRPAWIDAYADGRHSRISFGPTTRTGYLGASLYLRTADAGVSEPIRFDAGGQDETGRARFVIDVDSTAFDIEYEPATPDSPTAHLVARPKAGA
jgi:hypothetical protein